MSTIEILTAGAGTGKTYKLAQILEGAVRVDDVRPEAVIATTFTRKAAAELHARVRTRLLSSGLEAEAQGLDAARIGTVHAVCGRIVADAAFELGLPPRLDVLDDVASRIALAESISRMAGTDRASDAALLAERLGPASDPWSWRTDVKAVVDLARSNQIAPEELKECARRSWETFRELLEPVQESAEQLDRRLQSALREFINNVDTAVDGTEKTAKALAFAEAALRHLEAGSTLRWSEWAGLATSRLSVAKKSESLADPAREAAKSFHRHPRLHEDARSAIETVFGLAREALCAYEEHKRARGVVDFTDQEVLALRALQLPGPRERLRDGLDLVLVDEFQDTSPLQLRMFLELAGLAKRSVWVGDQKQAIYGFRGADPALMDAAIDMILGGREPRTLANSWRSRPELVHLTSDIFVPPFSAQGLPEPRVRLRPQSEEEPDGLGPIVERWNLVAKNKTDDACATASGVAELLADSTVRVRDGNERTRPVRPGDIAVLCVTNGQCASVAGALAALGIPAAVATPGLLATPEARLVTAGLALWCDSTDRLARATIARLAAFPGDGDEWLAAVLDPNWHTSSGELDPVRTLLEARAAAPHTGTLAAFDAVVDALGVREQCLRWGNSTGRLANLEVLRNLAAISVERAARSGAGATPAGLLGWFEALVDAGEDVRAPLPGEAVHVGTWHGAKGLEWPVVVLAELSKSRNPSPLGTQIQSDAEAIDLRDPLQGRWLRYWPQPFNRRQSKHAFATAIDGSTAMAEVRVRRRREDLRLLYVGWTRAKDRLVIAERTGKLASGLLELLHDDAGRWLLTDDESTTQWAGRAVEVGIRQLAATTEPPRPPTAGEAPVATGVRTHPPAVIQPSDVDGGEEVELRLHDVGRRLPLNGSPDMGDLGSAVHGFLAADRPGISEPERLAMATGLLSRWGVRSALDPEHLLEASDALGAWVRATWPAATWRREWPVTMRLPDGAVVRGTIDLLLETDAGLVVIDHKVFPGSRDAVLVRAKSHVGQLDAYAAILRATASGLPVEVVVHLPIVGTAIVLGGDRGGS